MTREKHHRWGNPDTDGVRQCNRPGCTVRTANAYLVWQRKKGAHWRHTLREIIPQCKAKETT